MTKKRKRITSPGLLPDSNCIFLKPYFTGTSIETFTINVTSEDGNTVNTLNVTVIAYKPPAGTASSLSGAVGIS